MPCVGYCRSVLCLLQTPRGEVQHAVPATELPGHPVAAQKVQGAQTRRSDWPGTHHRETETVAGEVPRVQGQETQPLGANGEGRKVRQHLVVTKPRRIIAVLWYARLDSLKLGENSVLHDRARMHPS